MNILEKIKLEPNSQIFEYKGLVCEIKRHQTLGHLCGYVYVPEDHPSFGGESENYSVHGGITASFLDSKEWVFGFDCAHAGDLAPGMIMMKNLGLDIFSNEDVYRDWEYVTNEVKSLADQLIEEVDEDKRTEYEMTAVNRLAIKLLSQ